MKKLNLSKQAQKQIVSLTKKQQRGIAEKLKQLQIDAYPSASKQLKGGLADYRRVRVGRYRIVYFVEADTIMVTLIENRNDGKVYRRAKRKS